MTSSLVGSEMCIRDSRSAKQGPGLGPIQQARYDQGLEQGQTSLEAKRGAVSYTHLTLPTICSV
eukprot:6183489-Prorocentrum_lima.AAC.1